MVHVSHYHYLPLCIVGYNQVEIKGSHDNVIGFYIFNNILSQII